MTAVFFWSPRCLDTPCRPHCLPASVTVAYLDIAIGGCFFFLKHRVLRGKSVPRIFATKSAEFSFARVDESS